jgi:chemotaxis protein MotB
VAGDSKKLQPIIVKKIKRGGHGHHGGAWKIAYADFVTAMMAFFLLMWLLGSTTEGDKKGIAEYFSSPLKIALLSSGSGAGDASHVIKGGGQDLTRTTGQVKRGEVTADRAHVNLKALKAEQIRAEIARLEDLKKKVEQKIKANSRLAPISSQIRLDMTADGLRIQIVDELSRPMFDSGSAIVKPYMRELLREIGSVLAEVPNRLTLEGHTDAQPFSAGERGYSNWELSADRANASRRELLAGGLPDDHVLRVQGLASSVLLDRDDALNPVNRRISIIVMNREAEERFFRTTPDAADAADPAASAAAAPTPMAASAPLAPVDIVPQVRPSLPDNQRKP